MYDLVSFDVFDTLVHRKLRAPVDIFEAVRLRAFETFDALLNHDLLMRFPHDRMKAETSSRERLIALTGGEGEVRFDEIYAEYQRKTNCSDEVLDLLMRLELELEQGFLFASHAGLRKYRELRAQAHQVAFLSDMYHSPEWLGATLERLGFDEARSVPVFVSGACRKSKHAGTMFLLVRKELGLTEKSSWLHVGDNLHADMAQAAAHGVQTLRADWAEVDNSFRPIIGSHDAHLIDSITQFSFLPQAAELVPAGDYEKIGYRIFGPLVFGFIAWLFARCHEEKVERAIFIARDGWLPLQLFDQFAAKAGLSDLPTEYVYSSRRVGARLGTREWDVNQIGTLVGGRSGKSIRRALDGLGLDVEDYRHVLESRGFAPDMIVPVDRQAEIVAMLATLYQDALAHSVKERSELGAYFEAVIGDVGKTAVVDIGWNGNMQRFALQSCRNWVSLERIVGLYLGTHETSRYNSDRGHRMFGWLSHQGQPSHVREYLVSGGIELLEFALTADHGSTMALRKSASGGIEPVLEELDLDEAVYRELALRVQCGIRKFADDFGFLFEIYQPGSICSRQWAQPFDRLVTSPTEEEVDLLGNLTHSDIAGPNTSRLPLAPSQPNTVKRSRKRMRIAREQAYWKAGFDVANR